MAKKRTARKKVKRVGFGLRLVAALIDGVVIAVISSVLKNTPLPNFQRRLFRNSSLIIGALYSILLWVNWHGQTIGKKLMKIKVVQENGRPVDYRTAIIRYLGYLISSLVLFLGYLWIIWDEKKQGWHDKIARTYVVAE